MRQVVIVCALLLGVTGCVGTQGGYGAASPTGYYQPPADLGLCKSPVPRGYDDHICYRNNGSRS